MRLGKKKLLQTDIGVTYHHHCRPFTNSDNAVSLTEKVSQTQKKRFKSVYVPPSLNDTSMHDDL